MFIFALSRRNKNFLMLATDFILVPLSLWLAFVLRLGVWFWPNSDQIWLFIVAPLLGLPIFIKFGLYKSVVRYIGYKAMLEVIKATGLLVVFWVLTFTILFPFFLDFQITFPRFFTHEIRFPRSVPFLYWITLLLTIGGSRLVARWLFLTTSTSINSKPKKNILIYGVGRAGMELASSLSHNSDIKILGIIDDDKTLTGHYIHNLKVLGDRTTIETIRAQTGPLEVLLAMPNMSRKQRKELLKYLEDKKLAVKTVPSLNDIASGKAIISDLQEINITDLLRREEIEPRQNLLSACISNKNVLVTGAGGSIGSELCRQILQLSPLCIVLLDHAEHNLYSINLELSNLCKKTNSPTRIIPILGSITRKELVEKTINDFKIGTIYHAAAYKHVNLIEHNIKEGIINNVFGTFNVAQSALKLNVESFILVSTDKAVRPSSIMGATKRVSERITQGLSKKQEIKYKNAGHKTRFVIVRFGNVLGSSGSVIPLFNKQIASGGPLTITHPEATRYFMTVSEASQLVIQAGSIGGDCSVFVLDMGKPISILSLAKQMIYLSGNLLKSEEGQKDDTGIKINYTGLQKGEKIHEELFINKNTTSTEHPMIMKAQEGLCSWSEAKEILATLESNLKSENTEKLRQLLMSFTKEDIAEKSVLPS